MTSTLAYRTSTGDKTAKTAVDDDLSYDVRDYLEEHEPHCYVCGRHTDHFAEHDDLVETGLVKYDANGDVYWVQLLDKANKS